MPGNFIHPLLSLLACCPRSVVWRGPCNQRRPIFITMQQQQAYQNKTNKQKNNREESVEKHGTRKTTTTTESKKKSGERRRKSLLLFVGCLTSQQQASVSQGRTCSDNFSCCHTEIEVADQTFYLTQSQYTDTGPTSPSADPITPGAWQGSHWSANF